MFQNNGSNSYFYKFNNIFEHILLTDKHKDKQSCEKKLVFKKNFEIKMDICGLDLALTILNTINSSALSSLVF